MPSWIDAARLIPIAVEASKLGIVVTNTGRLVCPNPECDSHGKKLKRPTAVISPDGKSWSCRQSGCSAFGDAIDLYCWSQWRERLGKSDARWQDTEAHFDTVGAAGFKPPTKTYQHEQPSIRNASPRVMAAEAVDDSYVTPEPSQEEDSTYSGRVYMTPEAVRELMGIAVGGANDAEVSAWAKSRGINPESPELMCIQHGTNVPSVVSGLVAQGFRVMVVLYDQLGVPRGVRMRTTRPTKKGAIKTMCPTGKSTRGLVMANLSALAMLRGETVALGLSGVVVAEGDPDFLVASSAWGSSYAVFGTGSGLWSDGIAGRIPAGVPVAVATHDDPDGHKYAAAVTASLGGRPTTRLLASEFYKVHKRPTLVGASLDLSDAAQAGVLPHDPLTGPAGVRDPVTVAMPPGYEIHGGRLYFVKLNSKTGEKETPVRLCSSVPVIESVADGADGKQWVVLTWIDGKRPHRATVGAHVLRSSSSMVATLADLGLGIHTGNSSSMVYYFDMLMDRVERSVAVGRLGWFGSDFLAGTEWLQGPDCDTAQPVLTFADDAAAMQVAKAYTRSQTGDLKTWLGLVSRVGSYPVVGASLLHILSSVLTERLDIRRSTLSLTARPGSGKSPAVAVAMSALANPRETGGAMFSWNISQARLHAACCMLTNMPLWLDDKQTGRKDSSGGTDRRVAVEDAVYEIANGISASRMDGSRMGSVGVWKLNAITTSERRLLGDDAHDGAAKRLIELRMSPWDDGTTSSGEPPLPRAMIEGLIPELERCYGHALIPYVRYLQRADLPKMRKTYEAYRGALTTVLAKHPFGADYANSIAAWRITHDIMADICSTIGGWPWDWDKIEQAVTSCLLEHRDSAKPAASAFLQFIDWCTARRTQTGPFVVGGTQRVPDIIYGTWPNGPGHPGDLIFNVECVEAFLHDRRTGFKRQDLLASWAEAGVIVRNSKMAPRSKLEGFAWVGRWTLDTFNGTVSGFKVSSDWFKARE